MSRSGRDDERDGGRQRGCGESREPLNYMEVAKQSRSLDDYKRHLADRGITPEIPKEWQKAMTAWKALKASPQKATERGHATSHQSSGSREPVDYSAIAQQFRHRSEYERYLVRELGLRPGTDGWGAASRNYDLKEHLDSQQRRPDRTPLRDLDERRAIERAEDRLIQVARESRTSEEFARYLREELHYDPGSVKYETAMLAWAVFKVASLRAVPRRYIGFAARFVGNGRPTPVRAYVHPIRVAQGSAAPPVEIETVLPLVL